MRIVSREDVLKDPELMVVKKIMEQNHRKTIITHAKRMSHDGAVLNSYVCSRFFICIPGENIHPDKASPDWFVSYYAKHFIEYGRLTCIDFSEFKVYDSEQEWHQSYKEAKHQSL